MYLFLTHCLFSPLCVAPLNLNKPNTWPALCIATCTFLSTFHEDVCMSGALPPRIVSICSRWRWQPNAPTAVPLKMQSAGELYSGSGRLDVKKDSLPLSGVELLVKVAWIVHFLCCKGACLNPVCGFEWDSSVLTSYIWRYGCCGVIGVYIERGFRCSWFRCSWRTSILFVLWSWCT